MQRKAYPTDLTDHQWQLAAPFFEKPDVLPKDGRTGRPRDHSYREIVNAILYVLRTGCQWEMLPHDLPPWRTVYTYFRQWRLDGTWQQLHESLREKLRVKAGREATPSAAVLDSQSVKTTEKGGLPNRSLLALMAESLSKDVNDTCW